MLNYSKFACNDYNYASVMAADLDEYLEDNNLNLFDLNYAECSHIAYELSGLEQKSYTCNTAEAAICLANNYSYVRYLLNEKWFSTECYVENPEYCDSVVRYNVTLDIINERLDEHAR